MKAADVKRGAALVRSHDQIVEALDDLAGNKSYRGLLQIGEWDAHGEGTGAAEVQFDRDFTKNVLEDLLARVRTELRDLCIEMDEPKEKRS